jgi:hypothetical protein
MRSIATLAGVLIASGAGFYAYNASLTSAGVTQAPPQQQIDVVDIRSNLLQIAQAERIYLAAHGSYATLEQLQQETPSIGTDNRGYQFAIAIDGVRGFTVTATPTDPSKPGWPTLTIDETLQVK